VRLFLFLLLQALVFLPITSLASESGKGHVTADNNKTKVTATQKANIKKTYGKLPLYFIENKGQVDRQVSFYEMGAGHATFFTEDGVILSLIKKEDKANKPSFNKDILAIKKEKFAKSTSEAVSLSFVGANKKAKIFADNKKTGHVNYFIGNDKSKWRSNIPTYGAVTYKDVYKNIDIKFYGNNKNIEHDVIVHPGGDFSLVKFTYEGVKGLKVTEKGNLEVTLNHGKIIGQKPVIYQELKGKRVAVEGAYRILKGEKGAFTYGFLVASYDHTKDLVIDPVLVWSTYLGGFDYDSGLGIAVDNTGAAYVTGDTLSTDFPLMNPIQGTYGGEGRVLPGGDAFVTKINPAGSALIYSTYLGGSDQDNGTNIAVDSAGSAYVTGYTSSTDFPLMSPIQATLGGASDVFITKISPAGTALVYSTYLGGFDYDFGSHNAVDSTGAVYITGQTTSMDFPLVAPIQATFGGGFADAFVTKINPAGSLLVYSTYLGGLDYDYGLGIAIDNTNAAYITGQTLSMDFPLVGPIQAQRRGWQDAFVTKINPAGSLLVYSTYLGGFDADFGSGIAVDSTGAAYLTGWTTSMDFPLVAPIQATFGGGIADAFVSKINPSGTALIYSTYLGGLDIDEASGIAVDSAGAVYLTGWTYSTDFPLMRPRQATLRGWQDAFVTKVNPAGSLLVSSSYLGGSYEDYGLGIALDSSGNAYVTGQTDSSDFPLSNPLQATLGGTSDAFITITKVSPLIVTLAITPDTVSVARGSTLGYRVTATNSTATRQCFQYWENVTLPGGVTFPRTHALFGPVNLCLNAGASKSAHLTHGLPMIAPVGAYVFNTYAGTYPTPVTSEAHFNFDVTAFNPATKSPQTSWRLLENGFRK